MFLKVILKRCLCNGSHLFKNAYKVLSFENVFKMKVWVYKNVFVVSKLATRSESTYSKGVRCSFPLPLDVAILPLFW